MLFEGVLPGEEIIQGHRWKQHEEQGELIQHSGLEGARREPGGKARMDRRKTKALGGK